MLELSKILKRRTQQSVFSQPARKPWMQIHQRTVRRIKVDITTQAFKPTLTRVWFGKNFTIIFLGRLGKNITEASDV
jgi:hypothetical protein